MKLTHAALSDAAALPGNATAAFRSRMADVQVYMNTAYNIRRFLRDSTSCQSEWFAAAVAANQAPLQFAAMASYSGSNGIGFTHREANDLFQLLDGKLGADVLRDFRLHGLGGHDMTRFNQEMVKLLEKSPDLVTKIKTDQIKLRAP